MVLRTLNQFIVDVLLILLCIRGVVKIIRSNVLYDLIIKEAPKCLRLSRPPHYGERTEELDKVWQLRSSSHAEESPVIEVRYSYINRYVL
jgi:hypothetical protein